ncbi:MAG: hypothetical protein M1820_010382 [Bogoriella megaspora]|nr:MAG: hypothetical protein M1820_010382 [Bogoriella megaspora]
MSPFSRGCLLLKCSRTSFPKTYFGNKPSLLGWTPSTRSATPSRPISISRCLEAAAKSTTRQTPHKKASDLVYKSPTLKKIAPGPVTGRPPSSTPFSETTLRESLLRNPTPTLLYKAPSHRFLTFVSFTACASCLAAGFYSYMFNYKGNYKGEGIIQDGTPFAPWMDLTFGLVAVFLILFACNFATAPFGMVKSISAFAKDGVASRQLFLRIERNSVIPFRKPAPIELPPSEVAISEYVLPPIYRDKPEEAQAITRMGESYKFTGLDGYFNDFKKIFSRSHIIYLRLPGERNLKLDTHGGVFETTAGSNAVDLDLLVKVK